jgi:ligand-binding sensor domain-containing protein
MYFHMGKARTHVVLSLGILLACCACSFALDPSLDVSQYAHTAWTIRDGFFKGNIHTIVQTPDGYLWLGTAFGLLRFDGVRSIPWQPPAGQQLPHNTNTILTLLAARDGTLWIGTSHGLASWNGAKLIRYPELDGHIVGSLLEDHEGTVWAGALFWAATPGTPTGRLCAMRSGRTLCYGEDGAFGRAVWALYEDSSGNLWAGAESGLWRWKPGPAKRYATPMEVIGLSKADDGRLLIAMRGAGLRQLVGDKVESYPIRGTINPNRLFRDGDGGLWIGTADRGLIHIHHGRTDVFSRSDGLSGDVILSLFEDREGNVWAATNGGLDRFREFPVTYYFCETRFVQRC